jgi:dihydrofolate reductase
MRVLCMFDFIVSPLAEVKDCVEEGKVYTVKGEQIGYSAVAQMYIDAYSFYEVDGLYDKRIFIPLSDEEDEVENKQEKKRN